MKQILLKMGCYENYQTISQNLFNDKSLYLSLLPKDIQNLIEIPIILTDGCIIKELDNVAEYIGCFECESVSEFLWGRTFKRHSLYDYEKDIYFIETQHKSVDTQRPLERINKYNLYVRKRQCNIV